MIQSLEEENKELKHSNLKLQSLVTKAWYIIGLIENMEISNELKASIKTWKFLQAKADN
jgi:hypothetical protein